MPVIKCNFCGRSATQSLEIDVCMSCLERGNRGNDQILIYAIKQYLEKNPGAKVREVKRDLKIEQLTMDRLLNEGSLLLVNGTDLERVEPNRTSSEHERKVQGLRSQLANPGRYGGYNTRSKLVEDLEKRRNGHDITR